MVCSLHSVTTGSRDWANNVSLIIIIRKFLTYLEWKFKLDACSVIGIIIAGLHVEIFRHTKVLYLNFFSWGLLLNNGENRNSSTEQSPSLGDLAQAKKYS